VHSCISVLDTEVKVLWAVVQREPQLQFVLDLQSVVFLKVCSFLQVEGCAVNARCLDLTGEVLLVAEVVLEDAGVEGTEGSPWLSGDGVGLQSRSVETDY